MALVGLRWKLSARPGQKRAGLVTLIIGIIAQVIMIVLLGIGGYATADGMSVDAATGEFTYESLDKLGNVIQFTFLTTWSFQILGALMVAAVDQFLDLSRLLHLPIRSSEIFVATQVSGLVSLGGAVLIAFPVGLAIGSEASPLVVLGVAGIGVLSTIAARGFGTALATTIQFLIGRRRLRDITIVISAVFALIPLLLRRRIPTDFASGGDGVVALLSDWYLPSTPFAHWFEGGLGFAPIHIYDLTACGVFLAAGLWLASLAFQRMVRHVDDRQSGSQVKAVDESSILMPAAVAAVARTTRRLWWREPRLRAIVIQNTLIFGVMGVFGPGSEHRNESIPPIWLPFVMLIAHGTFMTTQLSIDGPGITLGLSTSVPRFQYVLGRAIGVLGVLIPSALFIVAIPFVLSVLGQSSIPLVEFIPIAACVVIMELVGVGLGMMVSVMMPSPALGSAKRREVSARDGCGRALVYMLFSLPATLCGAPLAVLAIFPWIITRLHLFGWEVPMEWMFVTIPAALVLTAVFAGVLLRMAALRLETREEQLIAIVSSTP